MKQKIHKRFIDESIRIRKSYIRNINKIIEKEEIILSYKSKIENVMNETKDIVGKNSDKNMEDKNLKSLLNGKLLEIETSIIKIQSELNPINEKIEKLKNDSKKLYDTIKEKYTELEDEDIQEQILEHLKINNLL